MFFTSANIEKGHSIALVRIVAVFGTASLPVENIVVVAE